MVQNIDVSRARKELSSLMDRAYFENDKFIILRRGIPMAAIVSMNYIEDKFSRTTVENKTKDASVELFGIWKSKKKSTIKIADDLRKKAWESHAN
jgi:hypothetical protein